MGECISGQNAVAYPIRLVWFAGFQYGALKECRNQNHLLKQLWDMIKTVQGVFQSWRSTPWDKIDTDALMLETKRLQKNVSSLPKEVCIARYHNHVQNVSICLEALLYDVG